MPNVLRACALAVLLSVLVVGSPSASAGPRKSTYTIIPGDNLWDVSERLGVSMDDIKRWNPRTFKQGNGLLLPGSKLAVYVNGAIRQPRESTYVVQAGDTLSHIAKRVGVTVRHLLTVNDLDPKVLKVGKKLSYYTVRTAKSSKSTDGKAGDDDDDSDSQAVGFPNGGRLEHGEALASSVGLRVKTPAESYGTNEVVETLYSCGLRYHKTFPKALGVVIGDISQKGGGFLAPHKSHQNGLDVDVGNVRLGKNAALEQFSRLPPSTIDIKRTWTFLRCLIDSKRVGRVFMNSSVQRVFREAAQKKQIDIEPYTLDTLFEYGNKKGRSNALIQSIGGHVNHFHVRFRCDADDKRCRDRDAVPNT